MDYSLLNPGLNPVRTMVAPYVPVVDYGRYLLRNRNRKLSRSESILVYHPKQQLYGLHTTLALFNGAPPVRLQFFLATMRDTFDTLGTSEAASVWVLTFLGG